MNPVFAELRSGVGIGLLAASFFWIPRIAGHLLWADGFSAREVRALTLLLPAFCLAGLALGSKVHRKFSLAGSIMAIAGIWMTGPVAMTFGWTLINGKGWGAPAWILAILGTALFPVFTFMMSVYDGTLGALAFVTTALLLYAFLTRSRPHIPADPHA